MCGSGPEWKREVVQDHKFTYIDVNEFYDPRFFSKLSYTLIFVIFLKTALVYVADIWTAYILITSATSTGWIATIQPVVPFYISKWIFVGSIAVSFLLLLWEWNKARRIIRSQDIAYSFTNISTNRYYSLKSYAHFCLFAKIDKTKTWTETLAFWIFFRLQGWKRILFAEAPRQVVNATILYSIVFSTTGLKPDKLNWDMLVRIDKSDLTKSVTFNVMEFSLLMFVISLIALIGAMMLYLPLLCCIRGNLKEYVCHNIDLRIMDLLENKPKSTLEMEQQLWGKHKKDLPLEYQTVTPMAIGQPEVTTMSLSRRSSESVSSHMTGQSRRGLIDHHERMPPPVPPVPAMPPMQPPPPFSSSLPPYSQAVRSIRTADATNVPMPNAPVRDITKDGISNPLGTQPVRGFGARMPYRAQSRKEKRLTTATVDDDNSNAVPNNIPIGHVKLTIAPNAFGASPHVGQQSVVPRSARTFGGNSNRPSPAFSKGSSSLSSPAPAESRESYISAFQPDMSSDSPPLSPAAQATLYNTAYGAGGDDYLRRQSPAMQSIPLARIEAPPVTVTRAPSNRQQAARSVVVDGMRRPGPPPTYRPMPQQGMGRMGGGGGGYRGGI